MIIYTPSFILSQPDSGHHLPFAERNQDKFAFQASSPQRSRKSGHAHVSSGRKEEQIEARLNLKRCMPMWLLIPRPRVALRLLQGRGIAHYLTSRCGVGIRARKWRLARPNPSSDGSGSGLVCGIWRRPTSATQRNPLLLFLLLGSFLLRFETRTSLGLKNQDPPRRTGAAFAAVTAHAQAQQCGIVLDSCRAARASAARRDHRCGHILLF